LQCFATPSMTRACDEYVTSLGEMHEGGIL
jgi:hypothetical protein